MKAVYKILSVLLLCALFVGCASALTGFTESKTTAVISPTGVLQVGDKVTASVTLYFPHDYPRSTENIKLKTPLSSATWVYYFSDGVNGDLTYSQKNGPSVEIPSFFINYDYPFQVRVEFTGYVPSKLIGQDIQAVTIEHCSGSSVLSSYVSPTQYVYNIANFQNDVSARKAALSQIQASISSYAGTGVNTADAKGIAAKAEEDIINAENFGTGSITNALASLDAADKNIASAKEALNYALLNYVAEEINVINADVNTLNALGASDKATLVSVSSNSLVLMYNSAVKNFETDKTEDLAPLYSSAESVRNIAESYIAASMASASPTSTPGKATPTQTAVVQPSQTSVVQPTQTSSVPPQTAYPTAVQTPSGGNKITLSLDPTTMILLIVIVVLVAGLAVTILLYKGAKNSGGSGKKGKKEKKGRDNDKWESL